MCWCSMAHNYDKNTRSVAKLRATCGRSLLSTEGETWQRHRQLIQPAFQPDSLKRFVPDMCDCTGQMLDRWSEAARTGRPLDIVSEMMHVTLTIAARCLFGAEIARDADTVERCLGVILDDTWRRLESWVDWGRISSVLSEPRVPRSRPGDRPDCLPDDRKASPTTGRYERSAVDSLAVA